VHDSVAVKQEVANRSWIRELRVARLLSSSASQSQTQLFSHTTNVLSTITDSSQPCECVHTSKCHQHWATSTSVMVEACRTWANPAWSTVGTNTLASGSGYFSDPERTSYPTRFYKISSPW